LIAIKSLRASRPRCDERATPVPGPAAAAAPGTLALALPTAGFLVRTYIVFHDCAHGSFLASKRANRWLGTVLGLLVFATFDCWKHNHAVHHATAGDLDRRGVGDVPTLTVAEYRRRSWRGRLAYRLFRNPLVMFGLGPIFALIIQPRIVPRNARPRIKRARQKVAGRGSLRQMSGDPAERANGRLWLVGAERSTVETEQTGRRSARVREQSARERLRAAEQRDARSRIARSGCAGRRSGRRCTRPGDELSSAQVRCGEGGRV
jgi:hypothetical protein